MIDPAAEWPPGSGVWMSATESAILSWFAQGPNGLAGIREIDSPLSAVAADALGRLRDVVKHWFAGSRAGASWEQFASIYLAWYVPDRAWESIQANVPVCPDWEELQLSLIPLGMAPNPEDVEFIALGIELELGEGDIWRGESTSPDAFPRGEPSFVDELGRTVGAVSQDVSDAAGVTGQAAAVGFGAGAALLLLVLLLGK